MRGQSRFPLALSLWKSHKFQILDLQNEGNRPYYFHSSQKFIILLFCTHSQTLEEREFNVLRRASLAHIFIISIIYSS